MYLVLPDSFGPHGAYLHCRLAILPMLIWLACLRSPTQPLVRIPLQIAMYALVAVNLVYVTMHFRACNRDIAEFTAGIEHVGRNKTLQTLRGGVRPPLADHLGTAGAYYCLTTGNIDLDNYEAKTNHFPVRFRPEVLDPTGRRLAEHIKPDILIVWDHDNRGTIEHRGERYDRIFHRRRLQIYERVASDDSRRAEPRERPGS
jgi:hypothetical protein